MQTFFCNKLNSYFQFNDFFFSYLQLINLATLCFGIAVVIFTFCNITFIVEIQISVVAFKKAPKICDSTLRFIKLVKMYRKN